jgi:hypothetical protein
MLDSILFRMFCLPVSSLRKIKIYKTVTLPVVLYGCETWSLILCEEHRLRMFENRALWRNFRPKREEVARGWRRLHCEEIHNLHASPNVITVIKLRKILTRHIARMIEMRNA